MLEVLVEILVVLVATDPESIAISPVFVAILVVLVTTKPDIVFISEV